jgi:hypothetical protein
MRPLHRDCCSQEADDPQKDCSLFSLASRSPHRLVKDALLQQA